MTTRANQRRKDRDQKKLSSTTDGVTKKEQLEALAELEASLEEHKPREEVTFAVLLDDWVASEAALESLRVGYQRSIELRKHGRQVDPEKIAERYAQEKQGRELIEQQFAEFIETMEDETKLRMFLSGQHLVINKGYFLSAPEELKEKLLAMQEEGSKVPTAPPAPEPAAKPAA